MPIDVIRIKEEFKSLLSEADQILQKYGYNGREFQRTPPSSDYIRIRTRGMNLVKRVCGEQSDHYRELARIAEGDKSFNVGYHFPHCLGVIDAAARDYEAGLLFDLRKLIEAEVLADFIDQAQVLFGSGYHQAAASVAGAALENTLRKLCDSNHISYPEKTGIDQLNGSLAKAAIYDKLIQKRITVVADVRNKADHGHFDKVTPDDVEDMIKFVRRFSADYMK